MANELSTADKLAIHNQGLLVASAQKKLAAGKRLTKAELAAVGSTEREANKKRDLPYFERMPKGEYIKLFGGSSKVYLEWHRKHGFPWDPDLDHVDAVAVQRWYRETYAGGAIPAVGDESEDLKKTRVEQIKLRNLELDLEERELDHAERRAQLVNVDEFYRDRFGPGLDRLRVAVERIAVWPQAQNIVNSGIDECIEALEANGSSHHLAGIRSTRAGRGGKAAPAKAAHPSRVRRKVRDDAPGRPDGGAEVP